MRVTKPNAMCSQTTQRHAGDTATVLEPTHLRAPMSRTKSGKRRPGYGRKKRSPRERRGTDMDDERSRTTNAVVITTLATRAAIVSVTIVKTCQNMDSEVALCTVSPRR